MGKIGFFDAGFGGLAIMRDVVALLPEYDYVYLGDSARGPYGPLTRDAVRQYTKQAVDFLFAKDCELIIVACNTATSQAVRFLQREYLPHVAPEKRVLGVIRPTVEEAITLTQNNRIGIMATVGTVNSGSFVEELHKLNPEVEVYQQACPGLVPLIEAGEHHSPMLKSALYEYTRPLIDQGVDTIVLGCTHYGLIADDIQLAVGDGIKVVPEGRIVAEKLADYLQRHPEIQQKLTQNSKITFYSTRADEQFDTLGSEFFGQTVKSLPAKFEFGLQLGE